MNRFKLLFFVHIVYIHVPLFCQEKIEAKAWLYNYQNDELTPIGKMGREEKKASKPAAASGEMIG